DEHRRGEMPALNQVPPGEPFDAGPFTIETIRLSHSIPDSCGVALSCDLGTALVTGDYKFDQTPVDGEPADMARLAELGRDGLLLLCGDSTNVDRLGMAPSESSVGHHLEQAFARCDARIVVPCFASNIHRGQPVLAAAA